MADMIKLGTSGTTLRDYQLLGDTYQAQLANPMAAQINTKTEYGELESYSEWVITDWQAGVGKRDPDGGGSLFGHMDTRFPNQMILPLGWDYPYRELGPFSGNDYVAGDLTVDGSTITKASMSFTMPAANHDMMALWVYVDAVSGTTITADIFTDDSGIPQSSALGAAGTGTVTKLRPGPVWARVIMDTTELSASTRYHLIISGSASLSFPKITPAASEYAYTYDGADWTAVVAGFAFTTGITSLEDTLGLASGAGALLMEGGDTFLLIAGDDEVRWVTKAQERTFAAYSNRMVELNSDGSITAIVTVSDEVITDMITFGNQVVICHGSGYKIFNLVDDSTDTYTDDTTLMTVFGGYLWRTYENDLYYSTDGTSWTQVEDTVGPDDYEVRGMAELGENLYLSTDRGLYALFPGNYILPVEPWPTTSEINGRGMVTWNGAIYIPLAEDLMRFDAEGGLLQVGLRTGEELPVDMQGQIFAIQPTSYFLLASLQPVSSDGYGSMWAYNEQGWHLIGLMPQGVAGSGIYLDVSTNPGRLYWGGDYGLLAQANYPSSVVNPIRDEGTKLFSRYGWYEQDRYYGGHITLDTDWDGLYVDTEDMTSATVSTYWWDQDSTDWELLDSSTTKDFEQRWSIDDGDRPNSKWIRLGLLMRTDDETATPIIRAHSLRFHTMLADRWRWNLTIVVYGDKVQMQEQLDGTMQRYTGAQMKTHIESLIQQVPPFVLEDIDGTQYEAKVIHAGRSIMKVEVKSGVTDYQYLYNIALDQVTTEAYA